MSLRTEVLQIVIGIDPAIGDANSAERGARVLPLILDNTDTGFTLRANDDWFPSIAGLKQGAQWGDTLLTDGRQLIGDSVENVQETITLVLRGNTRSDLHQRLSVLQRFINNARQFSAFGYESDPVYFHWRATGNTVDQYALIHDISVSVRHLDTRPNQQHALAEVVIVAEREPAWRWVVPPGGNPMLWSYFARGEYPGKDFDFSSNQLSLEWIAGLEGLHLATGVVNNRHEFNPADYNGPPLSKMWIDIDAADIPGDAPALACISVTTPDTGGSTEYTQSNVSRVHFARSTRPRHLRASDGTLRPQFNVLNVGDSSSTIKTLDTTSTLARGVFSNGSAVDRYYIAATSATMNSIIWGGHRGFPADHKYSLSLTSFRGKWAAFARINQVNTSAILQFRYKGTNTWRMVGEQGIVLYDGAFAEPYNTVYMGEVQFPPFTPSQVAMSGRGAQVLPMTATSGDFELRLVPNFAADSDRWIVDVVLLPSDERYVLVDVDSGQVLDINYAVGHRDRVTIDSTGYLSGGKQNELASRVTSEDIALPPPTKVQLESVVIGSTLDLEPGVDNRIYIMLERFVTSSVGVPGPRSSFRSNSNVLVDIVPRSYGPADR